MKGDTQEMQLSPEQLQIVGSHPRRREKNKKLIQILSNILNMLINILIFV